VIFKDYFQFNKKEQNGILLLSFILLITIIYYNIMHLFVNKQKTDFAEFNNLIPKTKNIIEHKQTRFTETKDNLTIENEQKDSLFVFDPNTLNDKGWGMLGLSEKQISIFRNYQSSGVIFYSDEDLSKCYAISDEFINKITDYIIFPQRKKKEEKVEIKNSTEKLSKKLQIIDLNSADSILLISINGIGPFYSKQILEYRTKLGGFISYTQFSEIWGLEKLNINNLKKQTEIDTTFIKKVNINSATFDHLYTHPYINYKQSKAIINYRLQHGRFADVKDIQKIVLIDSNLFRKIAPYLKLYD
jgi:DNA uptake protein ComE-like DNA-binding protein